MSQHALHTLLLRHWGGRPLPPLASVFFSKTRIVHYGHGPSMPEQSGTSVLRRSLCPALNSQRHLHSVERNLLHVSRHRLGTYGRRPFAIAGPSARNSLPDPVRNPNSTKAAFGRLLRHFRSHGTSAPTALQAGVRL